MCQKISSFYVIQKFVQEQLGTKHRIHEVSLTEIN